MSETHPGPPPYLLDDKDDAVAALDANGGAAYSKAGVGGRLDGKGKTARAVTNPSHPLFSTAFWAYSAWKMRPSGENVPQE